GGEKCGLRHANTIMTMNIIERSSTSSRGLYYRVRRDFLERRRLSCQQLEQEAAEQQQQSETPRNTTPIHFDSGIVDNVNNVHNGLSADLASHKDDTRNRDNNNISSLSNNNNSVSKPDNQQGYATAYCRQPPPPSEPTRCVVLHTQGTKQICLVPIECRAELASMHSYLRRIADSLPHLPIDNVGSDVACVAYFPPEAGYFRAKLLRVLAGGFGLVEFVDFGNRCCLPACLLRCCPLDLAEDEGPPPRSYRSQLAGLCHRQYGEVAAAWLAKRLMEREVLVEFGCMSADDSAWPVQLISPAGLLDGLPLDRPELAEFFSEQHRQRVRSGVLQAASNGGGSGERLPHSASPRRLRYTIKKLLQIGADCNVSEAPASLRLTDNKRRAAVLLPGGTADRVRVLPLAEFAGQFEALHSRLQYLYSELSQMALPLRAGDIRIGANCVAKLDDGQCYRARILAVDNDSSGAAAGVIVRLVDLGAMVRVPAPCQDRRLFALIPDAARAAPVLSVACAPLFNKAGPDNFDASAELASIANCLLPAVQFFVTANGCTLVSLFEH
ncbi:hypothetical protein BOX15_Mlig029505g3, partial [Macrostomum lignano]